MPEPEELTAETLREIATVSGIDIPEEDSDEQLKRLRTRLAATWDWSDWDLGFTFDEAGFDYVHPAHIHRHRWDVPTAMNGNRSIEGETNTDE